MLRNAVLKIKELLSPETIAEMDRDENTVSAPTIVKRAKIKTTSKRPKERK